MNANSNSISFTKILLFRLFHINKIYLIFSFFLLIGSISQANSYLNNKYWKPEDLVKLTPENRILDTNDYLEKESEDYKFTEEAIKLLEKEAEIKVYVFLINEIHYSYSNHMSTSKNIELFANELAYSIAQKELEKDKNTIIIVLSIKDRQSRIRTGKHTKKILTDHYAKKYLDSLKDNLRKELYAKALADLIENIVNNVTGNNLSEILWEWFTFILSVLIIVGIICASIYFFYQDRTIISRLDRIKEITKNNVSKESFIDTNCSICLEEFKAKELEELKGKQAKKEDDKANKANENSSGNNQNADNKNDNSNNFIMENKNNNNKNEEHDLNIIKEDNTDYNLDHRNINSDPINEDLLNIDDAIIENSEKEGLRERKTANNSNNRNSEKEVSQQKINKEAEEAKKDSFIAKLNCGHIFHSECIANWMTKKSTCPLCKKDLEDTNPAGSGSGSKGDNNTQTNNNYSSQSTSTAFTNRITFAEELVGIQTIFYPRMSNYRMNYSGETFSYESVSGGSSGSGLSGFISSSGGASSKW